jgi:hypothetical protein
MTMSSIWLVLRDYSAWDGLKWIPVPETEAALIRREDILLIERLKQPLESVPYPSPLLFARKTASEG